LTRNNLDNVENEKENGNLVTVGPDAWVDYQKGRNEKEIRILSYQQKIYVSSAYLKSKPAFSYSSTTACSYLITCTDIHMAS
jgi:hypothetical protein